MMKNFLAHSAKNGCPAQTYEEHIRNVHEKAAQYASEAERYAVKANGLLTAAVRKSALLHDLGKLEDENQKALRNNDSGQHNLPINHTDAGSAALKSCENLYEALLVYSHHKGLPDMTEERQRENAIFRDKHPTVREHTDSVLSDLLERHNSLNFPQPDNNTHPYDGDQCVFLRMALSCLADADHTDTAIAYGQASKHENLPKLRADERLAALDRYVNGLGGNDERSRLRKEMYSACRNAEIGGGFSICSSPVGSGKTTAVMAHLLKQASERKARRIFVILPYTSIIQQSAEIYRKALTLFGENPEEVVAELHSRADFEDYDTRYLTSLWRAPIIVTTAVAFFETLSSAKPSALRKLHELPGSMIFIDEAHNALPLKLLPAAWRRMNALADEWSCYWVLASGSLVRYWQLDRLPEIDMPRPTVPELICTDLKDRMMAYEHDRIKFCRKKEPISRQELIGMVQNAPGPRLLILNTVQSAAVIASDMSEQLGRTHVEHLSSALTPKDRSAVISRIKHRLENNTDTDWTLVATSCVEAGVDFSFRTGFREISSLLSLLQSAGRINRHGKFADAEMQSFSMQDDSALSRSKNTECSAAVLNSYFEKGIPITPELSTRSMNDELIRDDSCLKAIKEFMTMENEMQFQEIDKKFKVIDPDTVTVVVDPLIAEKIACGKGDRRLLQKNSVSVRHAKIGSWHLESIANGVYLWTLGYDDFLGYMKGVLDISKAKNNRNSPSL